eukprot:CAMPEP_0177664552 /NCGR_PEP_ID=MMETSP0447-20121125/20559_1 /TAXON_ID=0 /ORGANISM="Stygamoeba regulata, Strain BSH-02190019" /LENGTH=930 /DNA_ID=CAMNT_0019170541 /DNA_START=134 /DNA_END=2926 /DNA_ORIENTATION=+
MADFEPVIGIVTAMELEAFPFRSMMSDSHERHQSDCYFDCGQLAGHQVVLSWPARTGTTSTALLVKTMLDAFPSVRTLFMVGIAGGVEHPEKGIRFHFGDVVVSSPKSAVFQWDFTRYKEGTLEKTSHAYSPPDKKFGQAVQRVLSNFRLPNKPEKQCFAECIAEICKLEGYERPKGAGEDMGVAPSLPTVRLGTIASGNGVVKDAALRDMLRKMYAPEALLLALEMESAGAADAAQGRAGCMFVRGICDYADEEKHKTWQRYAAATAAAFVQVLLKYVSTVDGTGSHPSPFQSSSAAFSGHQRSWLIRLDTFKDSTSSVQEIARAVGVRGEKFDHTCEPILQSTKVDRLSFECDWDAWRTAVKTTYCQLLQDIAGSGEPNSKVVVTGRAPISLFLYMGIHSQTARFDIANFNYGSGQWEVWSYPPLCKNPTDRTAAVFGPPTFQRVESVGVVVLFMSLNASYSVAPSEFEHLLFPAGRSLMGIVFLRPTSTRMVSPEKFGQIRGEFLSFLDEACNTFPGREGFMIASCLPQPLNFLFGTLVKPQVHGTIALLERVGKEYCTAFTCPGKVESFTKAASLTTSTTGDTSSEIDQPATAYRSVASQQDEKKVVLDVNPAKLTSAQLHAVLDKVLHENPGFVIVRLERGSLIVWLRAAFSYFLGTPCYFALCATRIGADFILNSLLGRGLVLNKSGTTRVPLPLHSLFSFLATDAVFFEAHREENDPPRAILTRSTRELEEFLRLSDNETAGAAQDQCAATSSTRAPGTATDFATTSSSSSRFLSSSQSCTNALHPVTPSTVRSHEHRASGTSSHAYESPSSTSAPLRAPFNRRNDLVVESAPTAPKPVDIVKALPKNDDGFRMVVVELRTDLEATYSAIMSLIDAGKPIQAATKLADWSTTTTSRQRKLDAALRKHGFAYLYTPDESSDSAL